MYSETSGSSDVTLIERKSDINVHQTEWGCAASGPQWL